MTRITGKSGVAVLLAAILSGRAEHLAGQAPGMPEAIAAAVSARFESRDSVFLVVRERLLLSIAGMDDASIRALSRLLPDAVSVGDATESGTCALRSGIPCVGVSLLWYGFTADSTIVRLGWGGVAVGRCRDSWEASFVIRRGKDGSAEVGRVFDEDHGTCGPPVSRIAPVVWDRRLVSDTAVMRLVFTGVFERLAEDAAAAALDSTRQPAWQFSVPDSLARHWSALESHMLRVVGGRPRTNTDDSYSWLSITRVMMRADTLVAEYSIGSQWRCQSEWKGHAVAYELTAVRVGQYWSGPVTAVVGTSSSGACPR